MAKAYYLDFTVTLYATKTIVADSEEQAWEIADALATDETFFREQLIPEFRDAEILQENMYEADGSNGWYVSCMGIDDALIEEEKQQFRFLDAETIAEYIGEE